jgi:hypothetical protein
MITADVDECSKSLETYKAEVERKLKAMVAGFAREIAETASSKTAIGDEAKFFSLYQQRQMATGIEAKAGFHKGAWVYTEGGLTFDPNIYSTGVMANEVEYQARTNYKIGDSFSIGAEGTAYEFLQTRDDIEGETLSAIQTAHKVNLPRYFKEG